LYQVTSGCTPNHARHQLMHTVNIKARTASAAAAAEVALSSTSLWPFDTVNKTRRFA
ncbi:hypothetical protein BGZ65_004655, partial [Modicella reniformis]